MKPPKHLTHIEPLEDRIAPALILNPYTVTYQDANGDTAVVKISKPLFTNATTAGNILQFTTTVSKATLTFTDNNTPESLSNINLLARTDATGLNISVTVLPQVGVGNLEVDVGSINAANFNTPNQVSENIDLGSIYIQGNLGYITAGASNYFFTPSIQSLTVQSMTTPDASTVLGPIGSLSVKGNFNALQSSVTNSAASASSISADRCRRTPQAIRAPARSLLPAPSAPQPSGISSAARAIKPAHWLAPMPIPRASGPSPSPAPSAAASPPSRAAPGRIPASSMHSPGSGASP